LTEQFKPGLYEDLITQGLRVELEKISSEYVVGESSIDPAEIPSRLSRHLARILLRSLESLDDESRKKIGPEFVREIIKRANSFTVENEDESTEFLSGDPTLLSEVSIKLPDGSARQLRRPLTSLIDTTFLTNANGEPRLQHELESEIDSAASIDILMAFVRWTGVRPLFQQFKEHIARGGRIRLITTVYTGSTEQRALDELMALGVQVKVSYDTAKTRLHAKAWLFNRPRGFSTSYIGSSNMTASAQVDGIEWNVRIAEATNADIIQKFRAVFESYWQNIEFKNYDRQEFSDAMKIQTRDEIDISSFVFEPRPFQQLLLDNLQASREAGFHRNLLVAATGTGKTVMAAFDYWSLVSQINPGRLLFIAHRKEILAQSRRTFAHVLRDPSFGEMWADGLRPEKFDHVFASIQTLAQQDLESIDRNYYDMIIIDEFHHAAESSVTYKRVLDHFTPKELLGLTATPERGDEQSILKYFGDRIAAELRIWDAIDQQYLCPFSYFGVSDDMDISKVAWRRGHGYDVEELTNVYTANHQWISLVIQQVKEKILNPRTMKALGFCVGVRHAQFVADQFNKAGIVSVPLFGTSSTDERADAMNKLRNGEIQAIFTVDIFNEGVDIPEADTLLLLRPTDSALLFMQQLGRGLRRAPNKTMCTVLDFVGHHRKEFRYENRFRALIGGTRTEIERSVMDGFPFLPAGCQINLDRRAQSEILLSLKNSVPSQWPKMVAELKSLGDVSFKQFLTETGLVLSDIYSKNRSFAELRRAAGFDESVATDEEAALLRGVGRITHIDDAFRANRYIDWLSSDVPPVSNMLNVQDRRLVRMLSASITSNWKMNSLDGELARVWSYSTVRSELLGMLSVVQDVVDVVHPGLAQLPEVPLRIHALYSRVEIQAALDDVKDGKIREWREGVRFIEHINSDVFLFTIDKSSGGFSPTTRYRDYAISARMIHWESQSTTSTSSRTGQRYINQRAAGTKVLLFGRYSKNEDAFWFLGTANYVDHEGERPISFTWELDFPLPAALLMSFAAAVA